MPQAPMGSFFQEKGLIFSKIIPIICFDSNDNNYHLNPVFEIKQIRPGSDGG
jgi:hypothetical protein